ncbi:hypothetical protein [Vulcanisaeta distributa]|uniref:hypothetical protein n=1 Tax=Vulcanisaeta distributa TaxID=164451 RepID=UPI000B044383|nr:hypothetical protein [Vulcanisaeta distributa]
MITRVKRGGFILKREAFDLTPTGLEEAQKAYEKLKSLSERIISQINNMSDEELEDVLNQYVSIMPLIILLNLIPLELLMLMGLDMLLIGPVIIHGH